MSFSNSIINFNKKTIDQIEEIRRQSVFDLFTSIVMETPVDKGVLRNNWYPSIAESSIEFNNDGDKNGSGSLDRVENIICQNDESVYFTNNLDYAYGIEFDGISGKARKGMVRVNAIRWETIVKNNIN